VSRVYIVLLNWNNWPDTLECLESLLALDYSDYRIILCDNASSDGSLEHIQAWAAGNLDIVAENRSLLLGHQSYPKPLPINLYEASAFGIKNASENASLITIIRNPHNLGFAGGCNAGLRYALDRGNADYCWVLNNDTVVDSQALSALVKRMQVRPDAGICGSSILKYRRPAIVDALGGAWYSKWLGLAWHLGRGRRLPKTIDPDLVEKRIDYIVGSSMLVSRRFLLDVGLMNGAYFLYYEEIDWALRSKGRFSLAYAPDSLVYHKIGGSIGTNSHPKTKSLVSDFYTMRNRLKFTRQYFPYALPAIYLGLIGAVVLRLLCGQWQKAIMVCRIMFDHNVSFERVKTAKGVS